jgi:hypothetical protein
MTHAIRIHKTAMPCEGSDRFRILHRIEFSLHTGLSEFRSYVLIKRLR